MSSEVKSWMNILNWSSMRHYMTLTHTATQVRFLFNTQNLPIKFLHSSIVIVRFPQNMGIIDIIYFSTKSSHIQNPNWGSEARRNKNVLQIDLRSSIGLKNCFWWRFPACESRPCWKVMAGNFWFLLKQPTALVGGRKVTMVMHDVS